MLLFKTATNYSSKQFSTQAHHKTAMPALLVGQIKLKEIMFDNVGLTKYVNFKNNRTYPTVLLLVKQIHQIFHDLLL